jgi:hypothetical protein
LAFVGVTLWLTLLAPVVFRLRGSATVAISVVSGDAVAVGAGFATGVAANALEGAGVVEVLVDDWPVPPSLGGACGAASPELPGGGVGGVTGVGSPELPGGDVGGVTGVGSPEPPAAGLGGVSGVGSPPAPAPSEPLASAAADDQPGARHVRTNSSALRRRACGRVRGLAHRWLGSSRCPGSRE